MIGKTVSHFRIIEALGEGGMGTVYKAQDLNLDRFVALKLLPPHLSAEEGLKKRFIREAKAASALEHPNICTIYEIGDLTDGQMFMAMAYYEGESLRQRMQKRIPEPEQTLEIITQVASGLSRAHEQGIVHRDIKPANVMITGDGQLKILDFGVAKLAGQTVMTMAGSLLGTVAYMSPEQVNGEEVDARSDIFSLGVMLYEMLTGEHPFAADHEMAMMYRIVNEDPQPLEYYRTNLPSRIQDLIDRALQKDREKRLSSMKEFIAELQGIPGVQARFPEAAKVSKPAESKLASAGDTVGNYRLRERIGIGGMGEVWSAEQEKPFHRKVALKILKPGMDTAEVVARFEAERQALALMDHPCIAQVYDAGSTATGRPYIAMEYIKGISIDKYCDRHRLATGERLKLFMLLCEGVQHAHHKAVIHRDLKPSNVLITVVDDKPVPKIIDFGVAKATAQPLTERTMFTHLGQLIGTPEYMSPEQAELTGEDIDTRTDVYSLGVILYELLTGALPFDSKVLRESGFEGIRKMIREVEPPMPSTKVTTLGEGAVPLAERHHTDPARLSSQLKGDLDWIIMKALDKDRSRRYASAADLAADIQRHLNNEPVLASPPSTIYRLKKFIIRHKVGVAAASLVVLALLLGITGTTIGLIRAIKAERVAREEAETASRVSTFLEGLFEVSDPGEARGNTVTAREILDKGAEKIIRELENQPLIQARLMVTMGRVYMNLGLYGQSRSLLEESLALRRRELGEENLEVACSQQELATLLGSIGDFEGARPLFEHSLALRKKLLGPDNPEVGKAISNLANLYRQTRDFDRAISLYREALALREKTLGPDHVDVSNTLNGLAIVLEAKGEYRAALPLYERALAIREKAYGPDHPLVATSLNNLSTLHWFLGENQKARQYNSRALSIQEKVLGPEHPDLAHTLNTCANLYMASGDLEKTKEIHLRALAIRKKNLRPDHPRIIESYYNLACVSALQGKRREAVDFLREAIERGFALAVIFEDKDLSSLRGDPEFEKLLETVRERLNSANR
ncbi:MAG: serine/threonine protein kinase [Candidatus Krumholzibacteriota bacterium]|nr:serine/threonine protein kinase [Candidatus Krumholzibacteriota bacterium]